jgi:acetyl-CoA acetyltransferase
MLEKAGISLGQVDQVEINEAFAAQTLACQKECWLNHSILSLSYYRNWSCIKLMRIR